jgi:hypothetical protein
MKFSAFSVTLLAVASVSSCIGASPASRETSLPPGPVRTVTSEPGVVPSDTALVVRTSEAVKTRRAFGDTLYDGSVAEDVLDQSGNVLIPKGSPVEMGVQSLGFLGPGGAGMWELVLGLRTVTVNGVRYPVESAGNGWDRDGGLEDNRHTAKWIGGGGEAGPVLTSGRRINVPADTLLRFQTDDPIRLKGYQR